MNAKECQQYLEEQEPEVYKFLAYAAGLIDYWDKLPEIDKATGRKHTQRDRIEGVVFSLLVAIDGGAAIGPYVLRRCICDSETGEVVGENCDIGGGLHERLWAFQDN